VSVTRGFFCGLAALGPLHIGGGEAERRADLLGDGHAQLSRGLGLLGVADFGLPGQVAADSGRFAHDLLLVLLASFLANDAAAQSFDERRSPPARSGVKFWRRQPKGPSKKFWRVSPQGEHPRSRIRQKFL
jgi:hypothetical protein